MSEGELTISIREDNHIWIDDGKGNTLRVFPDGTMTYLSKEKNTIESVHHQNEPNLYIRTTLPQPKREENVIGYGSAFAHMGFNHLL